MLAIFIIEDNELQRKNMEEAIAGQIEKEGLLAEIKLSTSDPYECISVLEENPNIRGLYFVDIDLKREMDGIELGKTIKEKDPNGRIVIVTTKGAMAFFTFTFKLEILDYIVKDSAEEVLSKMKRCLKVAYERYLKSDCKDKPKLELKVGANVHRIPIDDVCYIEPSKKEHNLVLHTLKGKIEFRGRIQAIEESNPNLVRIHRAYLVNMDNVKEFDEQLKRLKMANGDFCDVAVRKLSEVKKLFKKEKEPNWLT